MANAFLENLKSGSKLETIVWNQDPKKSTVKYFFEKLREIPLGYSLKKIEMTGIFLKQENRREMKKLCSDLTFELVLFKPDFTDDESDDHDDSEEESSDIEEGQNSNDEKE